MARPLEIDKIEPCRGPPRGRVMKQRGRASGQPVKGRDRSAVGAKDRKAPTAAASTADLHEQLDQRTRERDEARGQLAATSEVLQVISRSAFDLKSVLQTLVESAARLCNADKAAITRQIGGEFFFTETYGLSSEFIEHVKTVPVKPERGTVTGLALLEGRTIHVSDLRMPRDYIWAKAQNLGDFRTMLGVPMLREGRPIGVLALVRTERQPFTDKQIELVQNFAAQAVIAVENTRLLSELRNRTDDLSELLEQQTATSEVLKVISSSPGELEPVFNAMLENATRICEAKFGVLFRSEGDAVRCVAMYGAPEPFVEERRRNPVIRPHPSTALARALATRRPVQIDDIQNETRPSGYTGAHLAKLAGARTVLAVPMLKDNELIGVIIIFRQEVQPFTDKQIELVQNFAAQAVIAIENTRLLSELRESLQQQTATADVLKVISRSTFDLQAVLQTLVESAARLCDADKAIITREKNGTLYRAEAYGFSREFMDHVRDTPIKAERGSGFGRALLEARVIHIPDVMADPEFTFMEHQKLGDFRTLLAVPMLREGVPKGVVTLSRSEVRPFTDKQIELATTFADQAVIAIENVRLFDEVQQRTRDLSEALEQQTATSEVLKVISSSPGELEPVFNAMLKNAVQICSAKFGNLMLLEGDAFRTVALHGAPAAYAEARRRDPLTRHRPGTVLGQVLATKEPAQIADVQSEPAYYEDPSRASFLKLAGARTVVAVPMLKEDQLVGAIFIYRQEVRPFTDKQIELVQNFAAQAVIAIENTRLLNELRQRTDDISEALEQQTATSEVLKVISSSPGELEPVFNAMLANATRICEATFGNLWLFEGNAFRAVAVHSKESFDDLRRNPVIDLRDNPGIPLDRVANTKQLVHVLDLRTDQSYIGKNDRIVSLVEVAGARTLLDVPMLKENELVGVIVLYRQEVRPFTDKQIDLVKNFAAQAVIAIENTRLLNELRELLQQQTATADVLKVISRSTFDLQTVLDTLTELAARLCEADMAGIARQRQESGAFHHVTNYNFPPDWVDFNRAIPIEPGRGSVIGRVLLNRKAVQVDDVLADPEYTYFETQKKGGVQDIPRRPLAA